MKESTLAVKSLPDLKSVSADLSELTKSRLTLLVLFTTLAGFYLAQPSSIPSVLLLCTLVGTGSVAAGAAVLNQVLEVRQDSFMHRTRNRPLPSGRLKEQDALCLGIYLSGFGLAGLFLFVNPACCAIAALTLFSYLFIYTPLKRMSSINTLIGAIPGALPPVIGWTAAGRPLDVGALSLFLILFFWQMPHFLAIAWMYREDYARGGFQMLTLNDPTGKATAGKSVLYALLLLPCGLAPYFLGMTGWFYLAGATLCGTAYLAAALGFFKAPGSGTSRTLFLVSILYLPFILLLMTLDRP